MASKNPLNLGDDSKKVATKRDPREDIIDPNIYLKYYTTLIRRIILWSQSQLH